MSLTLARPLFEESILSAYRNKHLVFWFCKNGNDCKLALCSGTYNIFKTAQSLEPFIYDKIEISLRYKIMRIAFSTTFYDLGSKEFHNILALEKARCRYFLQENLTL